MRKSLKSLLILSMAASFNAFAISQSYLIYNNGTMALLRDRAANQNEASFIAPDFFFNSYNLKVAKSHYLIDKNDTLYTLSAEGFLFTKKFYEINGRIKEYGGSFFTTSKNDLYVVSRDGYIIRHKEAKDIKFKKLRYVGGNFMVTKDEKLIVVRSDGTYVDMTSRFNHKAKDIKGGGDNYFFTEDGTLYSIGEDKMDVNGKESVVSAVYQTDLKKVLPFNTASKPLTVLGGNYFFDYAYNLHTISAKGIIDQNVLGRKLMVKALSGKVYSEKPAAIGSSYFSYQDGEIFQVANDGLYYELGRAERNILFTNFRSFEKK